MIAVLLGRSRREIIYLEVKITCLGTDTVEEDSRKLSLLNRQASLTISKPIAN